MSEVTGASPPPPSQPSGGERSGPERIAEIRARQDRASTGQHQPGNEPPAAEQETLKARFDPAVAVSLSLLDIRPGSELRGDIAHIDGEGRPVLETEAAAFTLEPDAGLAAGDKVVILVEHVEREARGQLLEKNGQRLEYPVQVRLTLTTLHLTPDAATAADIAADAKNTLSTPVAPPVARPAAEHAYPPPPTGVTPPATDPNPASSALAAATRHPLTTGAEPTGLVKVAAHAGANLTTGAFGVLANAQASLPSSPTQSEIQQSATQLVGQHFQARLVIALPAEETVAGAPVARAPAADATSPGPTDTRHGDPRNADPRRAGQSLADQRLAGLVPGSPVILTVLAAGAEKAGLSQEPILTGVVTTAEDASKGVAEVVAKPVTTASADNSSHQYFTFDGGSFVFRASPRLAIGTPLTVALTRVPSTPSEAAATAEKATPKSPGVPVRPDDAKVGLTTAGRTSGQTGIDNAEPSVSSGVATDVSADISAGAPSTPISSASAAPTPLAGPTPLTAPTLGPPAPLPPLPPLPPLIGYQESWPVMDALIAAAAAMDPATRGTVTARIPTPGAQLPNTMLFFLAAVGMGQPARWLGDKAGQMLEAWKGGHLLRQLKAEFGRLAQISRDIPGSEWRPFLVPIQTDSGSQAIVVLTRPHHDDQRSSDQRAKDDEDGKELSENQRFLLEVSLSRLGRLQLDGLMRPGRLDLVIRGGKALSPVLRDELRAIFDRVMVGAPIVGSLAFEPLDRSPVDIRDILAKALPEDHNARFMA